MERVRRLYELLEARAWDEFGLLLADDVVYEMPQTRERITGRAAYVDFNATYPGDWHLQVQRVVDAGANEAAVWVSAVADGQDVDNLAFITYNDDGLVSKIVDFWPEAYEPPPGRPASIVRY